MSNFSIDCLEVEVSILQINFGGKYKNTILYSNRGTYFCCIYRDYNSVQEVLSRIKNVASEAIVKQVGAIYIFDVKGKHFLIIINCEKDPILCISRTRQVFY